MCLGRSLGGSRLGGGIEDVDVDLGWGLVRRGGSGRVCGCAEGLALIGKL